MITPRTPPQYVTRVREEGTAVILESRHATDQDFETTMRLYLNGDRIELDDGDRFISSIARYELAPFIEALQRLEKKLG